MQVCQCVEQKCHAGGSDAATVYKMGVEDENRKHFAAAFDGSGKRAANRNDEVTRLRGLKFHKIHKLPVVVQAQSLAEPKERAHAIMNIVWFHAFFFIRNCIASTNAAWRCKHGHPIPTMFGSELQVLMMEAPDSTAFLNWAKEA